MRAQSRAIIARSKERRDLALLTAYHSAQLARIDLKRLSFEKFRAAFEKPARLTDAEIIARLEAMAARGVITKH